MGGGRAWDSLRLKRIGGRCGCARLAQPHRRHSKRRAWTWPTWPAIRAPARGRPTARPRHRRGRGGHSGNPGADFPRQRCSVSAMDSRCILSSSAARRHVSDPWEGNAARLRRRAPPPGQARGARAGARFCEVAPEQRRCTRRGRVRVQLRLAASWDAQADDAPGSRT
jgi:hypothetical protein